MISSMELRLAIGELVTEARDLLKRLRSSEGPGVETTDLHILRVQLSLLDIELANMQEIRQLGSSSDATNLRPRRRNRSTD